MPKKLQQLAKLSRPRLYDALPRERLFALLNEKRRHPVIWVCGPPGSGKTTLLGSYLEERKLQGIWYQVDAGDRDISTFFFYLTEAAKPYRQKKPLPLLTPEYLPDLPGFARRYFRELFQCLPDGLVVLDNFHELAPDSQLQQVLATAFREVPANANVIVISRCEPPDVFAAYLATETLVRIDWDDLKLTVEEAQAIATARGAPDSGTVRVLLARTDGWVAGLTLMIERLRRGIPGTSIETESRETVFNYFTSQIFEEASVENQVTMLKTSLFSTFNAEMACQISGHRDASRLLDYLCDRQLFTYRRGGDQPHYQYHDLFRDFLRRRAAQQFPAAEFRALLVRAAELIEAQGAAEEAMALLVEAGAWDRATGVVLANAARLLAQGRWKTLQQWIQALPQGTVEENPWLLYWLGNATMQTDLPKAGELLGRAFQRFGALQDSIGQCLCAAELIRVQYYQYDDFAPLDVWIGALDELLDGDLSFPDPASELKVFSARGLALSGRQPGHSRLKETLARTAELLDADIEVNQKVAAGLALFSHYTIANQLSQAQRIIDKVSPLLALSEVSALNQAYWWLQRGYYHFRRAENADAQLAWAKADQVTAEHGLKQTEFVGRCFRAFHFAAKLDYKGGQAVLTGLGVKVTDARPSTGALFYLARCLLELSREHGVEAARYGRLAVACALRTGRPFYGVAWRAHVAAAWAMAGDFDAAERMIEDGWRESAGTWLESYRSNLLMARAYGALRQGRLPQAHACIRDMLRLARHWDSWAYLRTVPSVKDVVLEEALRAGIEVPFVQIMVRKFDMCPRRDDLENWPWPVRISVLGDFRIEISGEPLTFPRKAPRKPLALLKAILAFGGNAISEKKLMDALWPDESGDSAHESLNVSLHRLRRLLGHADVVQVSEGQISLDRHKCWVDCWALEQTLAEQEGAADTSPLPNKLDPVWQLYRGHFLSEDGDVPWTVPMRERLRSHFLQYVSRRARRYENAGRLDLAAQLYQKGIDSDDLAEELYQGLMRCHLQQARNAEAMAVYRRLRQTLSVTLGIEPSLKSQKLAKAINGA